MNVNKVLITGASTGIGHALTLAYAEQGADLWLLARSEDKLKDLAVQVKQAGGRASILVVDVTETESLLAGLERAEQESGGIDLAISNAGVSARTTYPGEHNLAIIQRIIAVNFNAAILCLEFFAQKMVARKSGHLVGITSVAGFRGMPGSGAYSASKKGFTTFMESLRFSMSHHGIQVTDVRPGFVRTPLSDKNDYRMPLIMEPERAASKILKAIDRGRSRYTFPWPLAVSGHLVQSMPDFLFDLLARWLGRGRARRGALSRVDDDSSNPFTLT